MSDLGAPSSGATASAQRSRAVAQRGRRMAKEALARYLVGVGGIAVIIAIVLIFFYLLYVVVPLFRSAETVAVADYALEGNGAAETVHLAMEEQAEIGVRFARDGAALFFDTRSGGPIQRTRLAVPAAARAMSFAAGDPATAYVAYGLSDGRAVVARHVYEVSFPENVRHISPGIEYPLGEEPIVVDPMGRGLTQLAIQAGEEEATLVAVTEDGRLVLASLTKEESMLDDEVHVVVGHATLPRPQKTVTRLLLDKDQRKLYAAARGGELTYFDVSDKTGPAPVQRLRVVEGDRHIADLKFLTGTISLIVASSNGTLSQWFPVRDEHGNEILTRIRQFKAQEPATAIAAEYFRKGFLVADGAGRVAIYHSTAQRKVLGARISAAPIAGLAVAPRADAMLVQDQSGRLHFWRIHNEHPEVSWSSLWGKVWYESYPEPDYIWQSSSASNDFEPKFSLVPLSFGTLKAAFYAMLLAAPLAILGAIFTAHFMSPALRRNVKPSIEVMEALPTVILGFLAGLWLAPLVEKHLPGIFSMLLLMPVGILLCAYLWSRLPGRFRHWLPEGWEAALLVPVVLAIGGLAMALSPVLEGWLFAGDIRKWLTNDLGIAFDQRNSLVVGLAMGFAVIPTIFSIAEDAIFGVPKHLTQGSLALGATPWQTLWRVVLLTASPGIFSALMIGLGRAVGETMIVLMATGNTPVMDLSVFQGMRTLSANIAVEMPESEVASTHYRVLFLAALVLFLFTFMFNTVAEIVRQRLRRKYSSL